MEENEEGEGRVFKRSGKTNSTPISPRGKSESSLIELDTPTGLLGDQTKGRMGQHPIITSEEEARRAALEILEHERRISSLKSALLRSPVAETSDEIIGDVIVSPGRVSRTAWGIEEPAAAVGARAVSV